VVGVALVGFDYGWEGGCVGLWCGELSWVVECVEGVWVRSAGSDSGECREWGFDKGVSGQKQLYILMAPFEIGGF
jgi:hypothetical protein